MTDFDIKSSDSEYSDSDEDLQEAFASGALKPGLNEVVVDQQKNFVNNVGEMKRKLVELKTSLPWIETLDLVNKPAPLAPEIALQMQEQEQKRANEIKNNKKLPQITTDEDPVLNDFRREMLFHRQAQATVLEGIAKLNQLGILTKRPEDFFAEMAKTDEHMQKIRENLVKKQTETQRSERVKQLRAQRKMGKTLQSQARVQKATDKKNMLDQVKKFRKGMSDNLNFLDDKSNGQKPGANRSKRSLEKEQRKNKKFGFGGKKKGLKLNTRESAADVSDYQRPQKSNSKRAIKGKGKGGGAAAKRPGKNRRIKNKGKGRK